MASAAIVDESGDSAFDRARQIHSDIQLWSSHTAVTRMHAEVTSAASAGCRQQVASRCGDSGMAVGNYVGRQRQVARVDPLGR